MADIKILNGYIVRENLDINFFMKKIIFFSLFFFLVALFIRPVDASLYYVSTSGNDNNTGTQTNPWLTVQKAANNVQPGDIVMVAEGTYSSRITISKTGTSSQPIVFQAQGTVKITGFDISGSYIILKGFTITPTDCNWAGAINVTGNNNLIENNTIVDSTRQGIQLTHTSSNNTVKNNTIVRTHISGITVLGTNNIVEGNDISDVRDHIGSCSLTTEANAVTFHGSGHLFKGNYIHDFYKANQNGKPHIDAFQTFSDISNNKYAGKNCIFEKNKIFMGNPSNDTLEEAWDGTNSIYGFMISATSGDAASNLTIRNNIIQSWSGFNVGEGGSGNINGLKIYNNTWRSSLKFSSSYWPRGIHLYGIANYEVYNNIFVDYSYAHIMVANGSTGTANNNLFWNSDGTTPVLKGYTIGSNDKLGKNPIFVNNFTNLHLQSSSPAINTGVASSTITDDIEGNLRPQGTATDIGAYEYQGEVSVPTVVASITLTPIPTVVPTKTTPFSDLDNNGIVNSLDYDILVSHFGKTGVSGDFNNNGVVDIYDYSQLISDYEKQ